VARTLVMLGIGQLLEGPWLSGGDEVGAS